MDFLSRITERHNHFLLALDKIRQNTLPVVLCGSGYVAEFVAAFLTAHEINIDCTAVSRHFLTEGNRSTDSNLCAVEDIVCQPQKKNYIIAFMHHDQAFLSLLQQNAAEIVIFDPSSLEINGAGLIDYNFCCEHVDALSWLDNQLGDELSRETLSAFLNQRICGQSGHLAPYYHANHYFVHDLIPLSNHEAFVDCGAYTGDSILSLQENLQQRGLSAPEAIYAFEPDAISYQKLLNTTRDMVGCEAINAGAWSHSDVLYFNSTGSQNAKLSQEVAGSQITVTSIDEQLAGRRATFIKMDIEGAELPALRGAEKTIREFTPTLAISFYHRRDDLLTIPQYIKSLHEGYRFYLRSHHKKYAYDLVLYALPPASVTPSA